jgi:hypothetical protein
MSHHLVRSHTLTKSSLKTVAAAVVLSALAATPVFAQAAIQEPGRVRILSSLSRRVERRRANPRRQVDFRGARRPTGLCRQRKWRRLRECTATSIPQAVTLAHRTSTVCTENLIRVDDVMESPKLAE